MFLDTNILVYAFDPDDQRKHEIAKQILKRALQDDEGSISSQVAQEFCNVILNKFAVTIKSHDLALILDEVLLPIWQHLPSIDFYKQTIELLSSKSLSFYDALIVQAAVDLGCETIYSEDLQDGQQFGKLTVVNPFKI